MTNAVSIAIWIGIFVLHDKMRKMHDNWIQRGLDVAMLVLSVITIGLDASWFFTKNEARLLDAGNSLLSIVVLLLAILNYNLARRRSK